MYLKHIAVFLLSCALCHQTSLAAKQQISDRLQLEWNFSETTVDFTITAKTGGWIGLGFSNQESLKDSEILISGMRENLTPTTTPTTVTPSTNKPTTGQPGTGETTTTEGPTTTTTATEAPTDTPTTEGPTDTPTTEGPTDAPTTEGPTDTPTTSEASTTTPTTPEASTTIPTTPEASTTIPTTPEASTTTPTTPEASTTIPTTPEASTTIPTTPEASTTIPTTPEASTTTPTTTEASTTTTTTTQPPEVTTDEPEVTDEPTDAPPDGSTDSPPNDKDYEVAEDEIILVEEDEVVSDSNNNINQITNVHKIRLRREDLGNGGLELESYRMVYLNQVDVTEDTQWTVNGSEVEEEGAAQTTLVLSRPLEVANNRSIKFEDANIFLLYALGDEDSFNGDVSKVDWKFLQINLRSPNGDSGTNTFSPGFLSLFSATAITVLWFFNRSDLI